MVSSDMPPPKMPGIQRQMTPLEIAHSLVNKPRFAFFKDDRGVVYCEQVDHRKLVLVAQGKTLGGKPSLYREVAQWTGQASPFNTRVRELYDRGFVIEQDMAYLEPNAWGVRKCIREVEDMRLGRKLRYLCRAGTPEGMAGNPSDLSPLKPKRHTPIQPFTAIVLRRLAGEHLERALVMEAFASEVTDEEFAYFPRWANKG